MSTPTISKDFSGVVIDLNHSPREEYDVTNGVTYYQTFRLPEELQRGLFPQEIRFPALSGFQLFIVANHTFEAEAIEFEYTLEQFLFGSGWTPLTKGVSKGEAELAPDRAWVTVLFPNTVEVTASDVPSEVRNNAPTDYRLALVPRHNIKAISIVKPNPYGQGEAQIEAKPNPTSLGGSFNFRLLALVADSGTDFLGDPYRSVAVTSEASSAGAEPGSGYWLSSPQPSQFAVVSHYSDVRPFPTVPSYGITNYVPNPSFEYDLVSVSIEGTEKAEEERREEWKDQEEESKITKKEREEKEAKQKTEYLERNYPVYWEPIGETKLRVNRFRGEWDELEVYQEGEGVTYTETLRDFEARQRRARFIREEEEGHEREQWKKEKEEAKITQKQYEEKIEAQTKARNEQQVKEAEERQSFHEKTKRYIAIKETRANNPTETEGIDWELRTGQFEAEKGIQYLEVDCAGNNQGVRLTKSETVGEEFRPNGEVPVTLNIPSTFSFWIRRDIETASFEVTVKFGNSEVGEVNSKVTVTEEWTRHELTLTPTQTGHTWAQIVASKKNFFIDGAEVNIGKVADKYIDGDVLSCVWHGIHGRSSSSELVEKESEDNAVVIDAVLIDPITSGVSFNIYYTNDLRGSEGEGEPTIEEWEHKLWTHVPQTYVTSGKTTYVLPQPITCKFVKLEFSQLQAKPYTPGDYQNPKPYKLFPEWVTSVFLGLAGSPNFNVNTVGVTYDTLELLYKNYLKDLNQVPTSPIPPKAETGPAQDLVDPTTLALIHQVANTYTRPPALLGTTGTLTEAQKAKSLKVEYPVEAEPEYQGKPNFPVSSLDRQNIVFQQNFPAMFFFVTCRHEYQELTGKFAENKAYYAGLKQLAFIRHEYTTEADGEFYIESGGDEVNAERNDFVIEEGVWYVN